MRSIKHCTDNYFIKYVLSIDDMYSQLAYDNSPDLDHFVPKGMWFLLIDGHDLAGLINIKHLNNVMCECHIYIREPYRGSGTEQWGQQVAEYMRKHHDITKFLAITPYIAAKKYAEKVGFKQVAVLTNSIKKNGQVLDQYLMEME